VTVIKCSDGYVFGGFTSTAWASIGTEATCSDAFVFSLHRPGGVGPVKLAVRAAFSKYAMFDVSCLGPHFGPSDITVQSGANRGAVSSTDITCYELPPGHPKVNRKDSKRFFTGSKKFQAAEVEVFRVA